jgi:hypothetical protein
MITFPSVSLNTGIKSRNISRGVREEFTRCKIWDFPGVTVKNAVFWDIKTQFLPYRKHITPPLESPASYCCVRFQVITTMTMKNALFWDVMPCVFCKDRRFGGTYFYHQDQETPQARNKFRSNTFLRNFGCHRIHMASYPKKRRHSSSIYFLF